MLELLIFAGAVAAAEPPAPAPTAPPPPELLEFIGEWSEEEAARLIDRDAKARKVAHEAPPRAEPEKKNEK